MNPKIVRTTTKVIEYFDDADRMLDAVLEVNPTVVFFNSSNPCSNAGYSTKPMPLGMVINSDPKEANTESMNGSGSDLSCSVVTSKGYLTIVPRVTRGFLSQNRV